MVATVTYGRRKELLVDLYFWLFWLEKEETCIVTSDPRLKSRLFSATNSCRCNRCQLRFRIVFSVHQSRATSLVINAGLRNNAAVLKCYCVQPEYINIIIRYCKSGTIPTQSLDAVQLVHGGRRQ